LEGPPTSICYWLGFEWGRERERMQMRMIGGEMEMCE